MNRKILFLLVVILANAKAIAQTEILTAIDMGDRISKTIVRQVSDGSLKHIVYAEGALSNYFVLADHTHASTMRIESRYEVNDFAILGDYLYFVGRDQDLDQGCVGWIKINSFFIGSGEYFVSDPGFGQTGNCLIRSLDKLVLNQSSNRISITAIGSSFNTLNNNNFCINIKELEGMTTGWRYELVYSNTGESFHDIIQTDNHVVTYGKYAPGFGGICTHIFDKNNLFENPIYKIAHIHYTNNEIQDVPSCSKEETFQPLHRESGIVNFEEHQEAVDEIESRNVCIEN